MCRDLEGVRNRPLQMPPLLSSLWQEVRNTSSGVVSPGTLREKKESRSLEPELGLLVSLQLLAFYGVPLHAGRALNACLIRCCVCLITVAF